MSVLSKRSHDNFVILSKNFKPNNMNKREQKVSVKFSDFIFIFKLIAVQNVDLIVLSAIKK